ncbi:hypothetical protein ACFL7M_09790 [Thermodesulfobacteriota bacterium]
MKIISFISVLVILLFPGCGKQEKQNPGSDNLEVIKIGVQANTFPAIVLVAKGKGFFKECGLDARIKKYPSGNAGVLKGIQSRDHSNSIIKKIDFHLSTSPILSILLMPDRPIACLLLHTPLLILFPLGFNDQLRGFFIPCNVFQAGIVTVSGLKSVR